MIDRVTPCGSYLSKDMVRQMMNKIFHSIETELNSLIALGDKIDSFNSLYMLVKMSHHVWTAENVDPASFLSTTLGNVLVTVKRNFDKCIVSRGSQAAHNGISLLMTECLSEMFLDLTLSFRIIGTLGKDVFFFKNSQNSASHLSMFLPLVWSDQADGGGKDLKEE